MFCFSQSWHYANAQFETRTHKKITKKHKTTANHLSYIEDSIRIASQDRYVGFEFMTSNEHQLQQMQGISNYTKILGKSDNLHRESIHLQLPGDINLETLCVERLPYNMLGRVQFVISSNPGKSVNMSHLNHQSII